MALFQEFSYHNFRLKGKFQFWWFHRKYLVSDRLGSISWMVWKLCAFRKRSTFSNSQQFFHHNFRLNRKFWTAMDSSVRSGSYLSDSCNLFFIQKNVCLSRKFNFYMKNIKHYVYFFAVFFRIILKVERLYKFRSFLNNRLCKFRDYQKNHV